jgi:hypothetical protein
MIPLLPAVFIVLVVVLALVFLQFRRLSVLSHKESDWTPILNSLDAIRQGQEQVDRSVRDEISRNRQEQSTQSQALRSEVVQALTGMGDSVSSKVEGLTRCNTMNQRLATAGHSGSLLLPSDLIRRFGFRGNFRPGRNIVEGRKSSKSRR